MKTNIVFSIREGRIIFLQAAATPKKLVSGVDVINIGDQTDAQISHTLKTFIKLRKLNFSESTVTVLLPRSRAILRHMLFPSQDPNEIRSMIDLQVGSRIPYSRDEVEIDFQILSKTADGYAKVAVVIVPQEIAMRHWKIFTDANIRVDRMTISTIGLWLLYKQQSGISDKPIAMIDLDTDHSEICICYKTYWLTSREIPIGFEQMQKNGYEEFLKQWEMTQNNSGGEKLAENLGSVYFVSTVNRAPALGIEIAKIQHDLTFKEILLTKTLNIARGAQWPKLITEDGVSIASLAGIAFSPETPPIDLVPRAVRRAQEQNAFKRQLIILGIWGAAALISLGLALGMGFFKKNLQLSQLQDQLRATKHDAMQVSKQLHRIDDITNIIKGRLIFADLAHEIDRLLPAQIYLVSITISDGNTLSLQGVSSNSIEINQFQKDMVNSPRFSDVSLDYVNKRVTLQGEVDYFKITCTLKSVSNQK